MISLGISRHEGASFISWMLLQTLNKTSLNYRFKSASAGRNADANGRLCIRRRGLLTKRLPLTSWGVVERQLDFLRRPRDPGLKRPPPPPPPTFLLAPTLSARPSSVSAHLPELSALLLHLQPQEDVSCRPRWFFTCHWLRRVTVLSAASCII